MARLLHRSKSTRELKTKPDTSDEEVPRISVQLQQPNTPNKLTRKRAGTVADPKLSASKSIADLKVTIRNGMVVPSLGSPKKDSSAVSALSGHKSVCTAPDNLNMGSIPLWTSSKVSLSSSVGIGVAIGSPTMERQDYSGGGKVLDSSSTNSCSAPIPAFYLPVEPFNIYGNVQSSGKSGRGQHMDQHEGRGGWRRLFGRGFFGSKRCSPPVSQVQTTSHSKQTAPTAVAAAVASTEKEHGTSNAKADNVISLEKEVLGEKNTDQKASEAQAQAESSPALLNVDIPTVEMERYSIMFRAFLHNENSSPAPVRHSIQKTTIYDRRKSKDTAGRVMNKEPPRLFLEPLKRHATVGGRVTPSPSISPSPQVFSQEIINNVSKDSAKSTVRLGRSNTTAALTRDSQPGPGFVLAGAALDTDTIPLAAFAATRLNRKPFTAASTASLVKTPTSSFDEDDDSHFQKLDSGAGGVEIQFPELVNLGGSPAEIASPKSMLLRTEEEVALAAELSIQRQISMSQRQLLLPVIRRRGKLAAPADSPPKT